MLLTISLFTFILDPLFLYVLSFSGVRASSRHTIHVY